MKTKYFRMANKPILALLIPMFWAAALVPPVFGAQAGAVFTSLYSFSGANDGANPRAALVQGSDGNFYGTTGSGGTNNLGTVFKITSTGALTSLYSFTGGKDGGSPYAGLVQGSDGSFYGTTETGGTNGNNGTVFKITSTGALTGRYSFTGGRDGGLPIAGLMHASDDNFYGTTDAGGTNGLGTVFKIGANGALTSLYSFTGGSDGAYPVAGLVPGSDGNLYGTTGGHGPFFYPCAVFKISTNGALTPLYTFSAPWVENPSGLVQGSDGNFYGATARGGRYSNGSVFNINTNGVLTNLYSFTGGKDGGSLLAALVLASDGNFYGTTYGGGITNLNGGFGYGTVFTMTTNGALTSLYSFGGTNDGANPQGALVQGRDGSFYGTSIAGGTNNLGTVFRLTIEPQLTLTLSGANVILSWPTNYAGWYLQQNVNPGAAGFVRITLQGPPVIVNGQFVVTLPRPSDQRLFYRLSLQ